MRMLMVGCVAIMVAGAAFAASEQVTQEQFGAEWPFTVPSGTVECASPAEALLFRYQGRIYALNGIAQGWARNNGVRLTELETIWKPNPEIPGLRVSISSVMAKARTLCR